MLLFRLLVALPLVAAAPLPRTEVPIKAATQANGVKRYTVEVMIDGRTVEAGLDTGSTGLRVLAAALPDSTGPDTTARGPAVHIGYGSGVDLAGPAVDVTLGMGSIAARHVTIGRVDSVSCVQRAPDCPAGRVDQAGYRIMGDGVAGQGFVAIMGIGLAPNPVANPLVQLGARRWIVELPRPGDTSPGRLILNPTDDEVARYKQFAVIGGNLVAACVAAPQDKPKYKLCRPAMLDSGANGLRVQGGNPEDVLPQGTAAAITIGDQSGTAAMPVVIGRRELASGMRLVPPRPLGPPSLSLGVAPYLYWSVLYDADHRRLGLAPR